MCGNEDMVQILYRVKISRSTINICMSDSYECHRGSLVAATVYKKLYFCTKSHTRIRVKPCENPYQLLQVTDAVSERAMKLKVCMMKSFSP